MTRTACTASTVGARSSPRVLRMTRPELMVWVNHGDGDALSIGGEQLHPRALRVSTSSSTQYRVYEFSIRSVSNGDQGVNTPDEVEDTSPRDPQHAARRRSIGSVVAAVGCACRNATFVAQLPIDGHVKLSVETLPKRALTRHLARRCLSNLCNVFTISGDRRYARKKQRVETLSTSEPGKR